jgi:hypothetical protein
MPRDRQCNWLERAWADLITLFACYCSVKGVSTLIVGRSIYSLPLKHPNSRLSCVNSCLAHCSCAHRTMVP